MYRFRKPMLLCVIALFSSAYAADSPSSRKENLGQDRVEQLFAILNEELATTTDPNADTSKYHERYVTHKNRITSATQELARMGDPVIDRIVGGMGRVGYGNFSYHAPEALKLIGSKKAQDALLDMALGRNAFEPSSNAAHTYMQMMRERKDYAACKVLLDCPDRGVQSEGLSGISGIALDAELFQKVRKYLTHPYPALRNSALFVISDDPSPDLAEEKVQAMVELLHGVKDIPDANLKIWEFEHMNRGNVADSHYSRYVSVLWQITGSDAALRKQMAAAPEGIVRHCLALALAWRDHVEEVRATLQSFLKDSNYRTMSNLRQRCVDAFRTYGHPQDIPFLKELAASDPYCLDVYRGGVSGFLEKWGDEYINLTKDQRDNPKEWFYPEMGELMGFQPKPAETTYPIRLAAKLAIKAIEDRTAGIKDAGRGVLPPIR